MTYIGLIMIVIALIGLAVLCAYIVYKWKQDNKRRNAVDKLTLGQQIKCNGSKAVYMFKSAQYKQCHIVKYRDNGNTDIAHYSDIKSYE